MSIKLNNVIFEHIRYRFEQWSRECLLVGEKDAVSNGVALAYWHLLMLNGKKWCWTPVRKIVKELRRRGFEVKKHNKRESVRIVHVFKGAAVRLFVQGIPDEPIIPNLIGNPLAFLSFPTRSGIPATPGAVRCGGFSRQRKTRLYSVS